MSRQSLAPTGRQSLLPQRGSLRQGKSISDSMASVSISRPSEGRRQSRASNGRQSVYGRTSNIMAPAPIAKDPRPIREKSWQNQAIRSLIAGLVQLGYPNALAPKALISPSSKDIQAIFLFLYSFMDPTFELSKKFEEEVPGLMKGLRC